MEKQFRQIEWDRELEHVCRDLVRPGQTVAVIADLPFLEPACLFDRVDGRIDGQNVPQRLQPSHDQPCLQIGKLDLIGKPHADRQFTNGARFHGRFGRDNRS